MYKTFDPQAEVYPKNFKYDVSLVKPSARHNEELRDIKSPIPNLGWISQAGWDCLRAETSQLRILVNSVNDDGREAKSIKSNTPSDIMVSKVIIGDDILTPWQAIGEGIFRNYPKSFEARSAGQALESQDWSTLVSRCILYRVSPDFEVPGGESGLAIYAEGERSDSIFGPGVVGFQSFMQRSGHVQTYEMEGQPLTSRLEKGLVAFYGAFQVPKELKNEHIIL